MGNGDPIELELYRADLHVHTVLSPCAEVEMIPPLIVREALSRGIGLIAITDHNSSANVPAVMKAAEGSGLAVIPGMELQTREEVHSLCLFPHLEQLQAFQIWVSAGLPAMRNRPDFFGEQFVVDATGEFIRREEQFLLISTRYSLEEAYQKVIELGGLFVPAHIDRSQFGLIPVLGMLPAHIPFEALEISRHLTEASARKQYPLAAGIPFFQDGDVHRLEEFLGRDEFTIASPTLTEIRLALSGEAGRSYRLCPA